MFHTKLGLAKNIKRSILARLMVFYKDQVMHLTCGISGIPSGTLLSIISK